MSAGTLQNNISKICVVFAATIFLFSSFALQLPLSSAQTHPALVGSIPRPPGSFSSSMPAFTCSSVLPCSMGISDFGTYKGTTYSYHAVTFKSWANFTQLTIGTSPNTCYVLGSTNCMTIQQNIVDYKVYEQGTGSPLAGEYWAQDVPTISQIGSNYYINQLDNIWNLSSTTAHMTGIVAGNLLSKCVAGGGKPTFYYCEGNLVFTVTLPFEILMTTTTGTLKSGAHSGSSYIQFAISVYHSGKLVGGDKFDEVAFNGKAAAAPYFFVNGKGTNPYGIANDAETVLCGPGGGSTITINSISASFSESYMAPSSKTLTKISHAWSAGYDTAERVTNVVMSSAVAGTGIASSGTDNKIQLW